MVKSIVAFLFVYAVIYSGLFLWRQLNGKQKWSVVKTATYSLFIAILSAAVLVGVVTLF